MIDFKAFAADLLACLRFYSRLPVPSLAFEADPHIMPDFSRIARVLPVAGVIIALPATVVLAIASAAGIPALPASGLALAALVATTGAFHEDGLADTADGFGGGTTRARKLDIMKDSRIGTYGGAALVLSLGLRWSGLAALIDMRGTEAALLILIAAAAFSRPLGLTPLFALPPARTDGAAQAAGPLPADAYILSVAGGAAIALLLTLAHVDLGDTALGLWLTASATAFAGALSVTALSYRQIGGQTGDVAGATQQVAEIVFLLVFLT
ncbi:adenosylcobinamide-GDP ribazoletransferase [Roseiarcaceae bacterium H3SJ34-1]|uniref:adenosylcobinamide-GDP ribazoletransferase n=1 Tax=Terripilifer ovatus TaxID=3032367 RepID=UPI003AB93E55|nr:adenosylcobinamide-GDP ribazoletransferase [Roseiarcaceae bacterium H3SJ34-1]